MANLRIYELSQRENYGNASGDYTIVDGESLDEALKLSISSLASNENVKNDIDNINRSASYIVGELEYIRNNIPSIQEGFNNNIMVEKIGNIYQFSASSYNVNSNSDEVLSIEKYENGSEVNFALSSDTYTKGHIDDLIEGVRKEYNIVGENNILVNRYTDVDGNYKNEFHINLDGITASVNDDDSYTNVSGNSVVINYSNTAMNYSFSQGTENKSYDVSFSQGGNNIASSFSFSQGNDNQSYDASFSQGMRNYAENISLAQGKNVTAKNLSFAQGENNYAEYGSMALGGYSIAKSGSISFGNYIDKNHSAEAYENSISLGNNSYASGNSYNFYGDSAVDHSFCVGNHGLVKNHTTALGTYNEPRFVSGDNPYTFALGDGTKEEPHTYFRIDQKGVFYSTAVGHEVDLTKIHEKNTIICDTFEKYEELRKIEGNEHKVFIVG